MGTLTLLGTNTYTGSTTVSAGILQTAAPNTPYGAIGQSSSIFVNGGGTLLAANSDNSLTGSQGTAPITVNAGGLVTSSGGFTNHLGGVLTLVGGTLGGPVTATGDAANWGTWDLDSNVISGGNPATSVISAQDIALSHSGGTTFNVSPGAANGIDLDVTGTFFHSTAIKDYGLVKAGAGVMRLDCANTYTGPTVINAGSLTVGTNNAVPSGSAVTANGTLNLNGYADTIGSLSGSGTVVLAGATLIVGNDNSSASFSGLIAGPGSFSKIGTGTLTFSGVNNCSGVATLSGGTFAQTAGLNLLAYLSIGNSAAYQFSGGTLQINGGLLNQGIFNALVAPGSLTAANSIIDFSAGTLQNTGSLSLSIDANSLLLVPPGFNPTAFGAYSNLGLTHTVGTALMITASQGFSGVGSISDHVNCQGTISAATGASINLNGGITVSAGGSVALGLGAYVVSDTNLGHLRRGTCRIRRLCWQVFSRRVHPNGRHKFTELP